MGGSACTNRPQAGSEEAMKADTIEEAQEALTERVMKLPGVVGTGISLCDGDPCIKVFLAGENPELEAEIPETFLGYPVVTQVMGEVHARPPGQS